MPVIFVANVLCWLNPPTPDVINQVWLNPGAHHANQSSASSSTSGSQADGLVEHVAQQLVAADGVGQGGFLGDDFADERLSGNCDPIYE
jgi:hypothetical protein